MEEITTYLKKLNVRYTMERKIKESKYDKFLTLNLQKLYDNTKKKWKMKRNNASYLLTAYYFTYILKDNYVSREIDGKGKLCNKIWITASI